MKSIRTAAATMTFVSLASFAAAQGVRVVDDSGGAHYTTIAAAIAAAAPGDTILVKEGSYAGFAIGSVPVSVVAEAGAAVEITSMVTISNTPVGSVVALRGLAIRPTQEIGLLATQCGGTVWIEKCVFQPKPGKDGFNGAMIGNVASLVLRASEFRAGNGYGDLYATGSSANGLEASFARISAWGCVFVGSTGSPGGSQYPPGPDGGDGARLSSCAFTFASCAFTGAKGASSGFGKAGNGGNGLTALLSATPAALDACSLMAGLPGQYYFGWGLPGETLHADPAGSVATLANPAHTFSARSPVREGQPIALDLFAAAAGSFWVAYDLAPAAPLDIVGIAEPLLLPLGSVAFEPFPGGPALGAGAHGGALTAPPVPALQATTFYAQLLAVDPTLTTVQLGSPSAVVVLDSAY